MNPWAQLEAIVYANQYMMLATAGDDGLPSGSRVWFATADCQDFVCVSSPKALAQSRHAP